MGVEFGGGGGKKDRWKKCGGEWLGVQGHARSQTPSGW